MEGTEDLVGGGGGHSGHPLGRSGHRPSLFAVALKKMLLVPRVKKPASTPHLSSLFTGKLGTAWAEPGSE